MFNFFKKKVQKNNSEHRNIFYEEKNALIVYFKCNKCGETFKSYLSAMANRILYHPANLIMYHIERRSSFLSLFI